jgi:hypothetical protein
MRLCGMICPAFCCGLTPISILFVHAGGHTVQEICMRISMVVQQLYNSLGSGHVSLGTQRVNVQYSARLPALGHGHSRSNARPMKAQ